MTAPARVTQADYDRAVKACRDGGYQGARIRIDLAAQTIDIFLGDAASSAPPDHTEDDDYD
ncbi:MAG: hypothetical protein WA940_00205 [Sphingopyxis sp.]